jgi:hypothetical protein
MRVAGVGEVLDRLVQERLRLVRPALQGAYLGKVQQGDPAAETDLVVAALQVCSK